MKKKQALERDVPLKHIWKDKEKQEKAKMVQEVTVNKMAEGKDTTKEWMRIKDLKIKEPKNDRKKNVGYECWIVFSNG